MESFQDELVDLCVRDKAEEIKAKLLVNGQVTAHAANGYHRKSGVSFLAYLGWTACQQDSRGVLQFLLKTVSGDVFCQPSDKERRNAIHAATLQKHLECLKLLCAANLNLNSRDILGRTPLHLACSKGFSKCAEILVNTKAQVNMTDRAGRTPLHVACEEGFPECAEILCNAKAEVNLTDHFYDTPLDLALRGRHTEVVSIIMKYIRTVLSNQECCLHCLCRLLLFSVVTQETRHGQALLVIGFLSWRPFSIASAMCRSSCWIWKAGLEHFPNAVMTLSDNSSGWRFNSTSFVQQ
eukprot:scpid21227/ scgid5096/ Inversin-B